jgi:phospholipid/cholesterol/gamma-HCH transport system substrate-binding protein
MVKQAPTLRRLLVMVFFALSCFGLLLFLWLAFGGPIPLQAKGYRVKVRFIEATQLAKEADVRISGVPVGKVKNLEFVRDGRCLPSESGTRNGACSEATIELRDRYAPLAADARAILRQKTLLGETYIELTPGSRNGRKLKEGGLLPVGNVSRTVELDKIFRAFDEQTRKSFQIWMQAQAEGANARGQDINDAFGQLEPLTENATRLLSVLDTQRAAVQRLVSNTGEVFTALSERDGQLSSLITNANAVFQTTAQRNGQLQEAFTALPTFERESAVTFDRLARFARTTNPLITQLRPAARELSPTLVNLGATAPDFKGLFRDLNPLIRASRAGLPALQRFLDDLRPLLGQFDPFLRQLEPPLQGLAAYKRELTAFFANIAAASEATDKPSNSPSPVHYLRTSSPVNPEALAAYPRRLGINRANPYEFPGVFSSLSQGLPVYDSRPCGVVPTPTLNSDPSLIPPSLQTLIGQYLYGQASNTPGPVATPRCVKQGKFPALGAVQELTDYPHVRALAPPR